MISALLVETAVKATCVIGAAAIANALLRRRSSAASRHLVLSLAVAALLVLPVLSASIPRWSVVIPVPAPGVTVAAPSMDAPPSDAYRRTSVADLGSGAPAAVSDRAAGPAATGGGLAWLAVLAAGYVAGLLLLGRLMHEQRLVLRLARRAVEVRDAEWLGLLRECAGQIGVRRPVRLLRSLERSMPMAFGIGRPSILVPSIADTWSEDRRRAVLLHELAHIDRHDCLTQLMAAVACAAFWMHPGAWWIARRLRDERELACDDRVLSAGAHAGNYAEHLLELAYTLGSYQAPALVVAMARPRQVEGRLLAVLDGARNRAVPAWRVRLAGVTIAAALLMPIAAAQARVAPAAPVAGGAAKPVAGRSQEVADAVGLSEKNLAGTWEIRATQTAPVVCLRLSESAGSSHGSTVPVDRFDGLRPAVLSGAGGAAKFAVRRDAGVLSFDGTFRSGVGAGTYIFTPSASFPAELARRGFGRPTAAEQYLLARGDIGFAFLDELTAQRYGGPDLPLLVRSAHHGVDLAYVREMGGLGYRLGQLDALIAQRDHGVSPQFIRELAAQGLRRLTADDLIRARDHGVSPQYVGELKALGYSTLSLDALVAARDHGISADYARALRQSGYQLTLAELAAARDHGVSPEYVRDLNALGYQGVPLDGLIAARDHGISPEYVRQLRDAGYRPTLDELATARDHGVTAEFARELKARGRNALTLNEVVALKDGGRADIGPHLKPNKLMFYAVAHVHAIGRMYRDFVNRWLR